MLTVIDGRPMCYRPNTAGTAVETIDGGCIGIGVLTIKVSSYIKSNLFFHS